MRDRRVVGNLQYVDALSSEPAQSALSSGANTADDDLDVLDPNDVRLVAHEFADLRCSERRPLLRPGEPERTRGRPCDRIASFVGEQHLRVVVGSVNVQRAGNNIFLGNTRERARLEALVDASATLSDDSFLSHIDYVFSSLRRPEVMVRRTLPRTVR